MRHQRELIEIVPPKPVGAAHISVLHRTRDESPQAGEAALLVDNFAQKQGIIGVHVEESRREDQLVAVTDFVTEQGTDTLLWDVEARVWPSRGLVCSFCSDPQATAERALAKSIFSTITALHSRAGLRDPS